MPAGSKMDPPLAKAEPISDSGSTSGITYFRSRGRGEGWGTTTAERGVRICERNNFADTKIRLRVLMEVSVSTESCATAVDLMQLDQDARQVNNDPECHSFPYSCKRSISLFFSGDQQIKMSSEVTYKGFGVQLPYIIGNLRIQKVAGYFLVRHQYAFTLAWDGTSAVYIKMAPEYLGKTHGLCGNNNAILQDDLETSYVITCAEPLTYNECINCCPVSCHQQSQCIDSELPCIDGCYCPDGLIYENELCVKPMDCPCDYHGSFFEMGSVVYEECNNWLNQDGSCIQSISLILKQDPKRQVTLTHSGDVLVYDQYKVNLPYADELFEIRKLSSVFLQVKTHIGLQILYDREGLRLYLQADGRWKDDTVGLCGTFNGNMEDDFLYD
ncbi:otogelin [Grus japonensis]|uniref:Otogelin n=1 Tax=Grus japonensis TaxID=30415 RepID=A0ABC9WX00_GRUJA